MQTIAFISSEAKIGQTTAAMVLASGMLHLGKRVTVIDCSEICEQNDEEQSKSGLKNWQAALKSSKAEHSLLKLREAETIEQFYDSFETARTDGTEFALLDINSSSRNFTKSALANSGMVIHVANNPQNTQTTIDEDDERIGWPSKLCGLAVSYDRHSEALTEIQTGFERHVKFKSCIPLDEEFAELHEFGSFSKRLRERACNPGDSGFYKFRSTRVAFEITLQLTFEVLWAFKGVRLAVVEIDNSSSTEKEIQNDQCD